ncbi:hypothetical protein Poli38472_008674 [Pythium oligandrum]|uniref:DUF676 domain-containing protein n=1 Tax=Pythium oligandrum TaxID=41045 RepID=A0A8K1FBE1_PYTOL|nr:hypothetical protein Poli38472_008674 [Pythium oligandrum]|eukprot:TMW56026.1 hypothetical protein Poli38472_008674 [Pythium oligandrum]
MSMSALSSPTTSEMASVYLPEHIVVLVHGNNGAPSDFDSVEGVLRAKYRPDELLVIKSKANHTQTSMGVDVGGTKLAVEVVNTILKYDLHPGIETYKFSIVCHSLGGLYARYAIAQIQAELAMLNIEFVSFVTMCTPHLGCRRPRAPSVMKNFLRLGVHTVLASKTIYGQTGIDLLVANDPQTMEVDPTRRPVLESMSDPESEFIRALQRFRHCTLIAMADGDLVVHYASSSIRNFNPYPSNLLTSRHQGWRWHVRHHGFDYISADFYARLNDRVDQAFELENELEGIHVLQCERFASVDGYDCDNKREVEFTYEMIRSLQEAVSWRRIDLVVEPYTVKGKMRLHDWPINKMQPQGCGAIEFIDLLTDMIGSDHQLELRTCELDVVMEQLLTASASTTGTDADDDDENQHDSRPSLLSLTKWNEKWGEKQISGQIGAFFQNVKRRMSISGEQSPRNSDVTVAVTTKQA